MFLQCKHTSKIKVRGCADGKNQRVYMNKDQVSAPTVTTESLFLTWLIDVMEKRNMATVDIPGAFMQAGMDEEVHMKLEEKMVDILEKIDNKLYKKYTTTKNGQTYSTSS